jgi:hypothetical protein
LLGSIPPAAIKAETVCMFVLELPPQCAIAARQLV